MRKRRPTHTQTAEVDLDRIDTNQLQSPDGDVILEETLGFRIMPTNQKKYVKTPNSQVSSRLKFNPLNSNHKPSP